MPAWKNTDVLLNNTDLFIKKIQKTSLSKCYFHTSSADVLFNRMQYANVIDCMVKEYWQLFPF